MITEDFYTGEPVNIGSPNLFDNKKDEIEAANMASFAKYDYDPGMRQNQNMIYPGYNGYNQPYYYGYSTMPPQSGLGAYPQYYNPIQPTYNMYRAPQYYQQQQLPDTIHIPGINMNGEYLPSPDFEEKIDKLRAEYIVKKEELEAKNNVDQTNSSYNYGYYNGFNYYGTSYYNPYQYNSLNQYISKEVETMRDEARENRMMFNLNMSRLAHKFADDGITEEEIIERYRGKTINTPRSIMQSPQDLYQMNRFNNLVPFDNSQQYRDFELSVQKEYNDVIPKDADLNTTFENMGILWAKWEMEEEMHRRRDGSKLYNSENNAYKYFIRKKAEERYKAEKGINNLPPQMAMLDPNQMRQNFIAGSPLSQVSTLKDDGTLNVSLTLPYNVGSKAGQSYTVNSNEKEYAEKRERFARFVNSIDTSDKNDLNPIKQKKIENFTGE